jgi:N utilization substance protein B
MSRHEARVLALQALYEADMAHHAADAVLKRHLAEFNHPDSLRQYAAELVNGIMQEREALDQLIGALAPEFPLEHLSPIDRNILRIALYEMRQGVVPLKVAISEAVNLARAFGSESSFRFVNGVLGAAARQ